MMRWSCGKAKDHIVKVKETGGGGYEGQGVKEREQMSKRRAY